MDYYVIIQITTTLSKLHSWLSLRSLCFFFCMCQCGCSVGEESEDERTNLGSQLLLLCILCAPFSCVVLGVELQSSGLYGKHPQPFCWLRFLKLSASLI